MKNSWKRISAAALSLALVTGAMPVNVGGFLTRNTGIVARAEGELVYTYYEAHTPTCTTAGNIKYYIGSDDKYYTDEQGTELTDRNNDGAVDINDTIIPATGHSWEFDSKTRGEKNSLIVTFKCKNDAEHKKSITLTQEKKVPDEDNISLHRELFILL